MQKSKHKEGNEYEDEATNWMNDDGGWGSMKREMQKKKFIEIYKGKNLLLSAILLLYNSTFKHYVHVIQI